jgi:tape measure domain-containing protein
MQSGGQAAGIQLQVGLDLAFFRNQLPKLGAAAAGYTLPINIKFDRRAVQNELNALGRNINQRTYRLEVATNLAAEIELAKKLTTALNNLGRSQQTAKTGVGQRLGVGAIGRAPSQGGLGSKDVEKLYRASARAGLLVFDKEIAKTKVSMVAAMDAIGVDAIAGLLNGLSSQDARLRAAAESIGENLIKTTKTSLGIASPSKKFEEIGRNVGKGFEKGALSSMDSAFDALENKMRQRGKILDTIARGIFGMLGMDPAAMMQQARQQRLPAAINWQATTPPRQPFTGPSSGGRALPPGPSQMMLPGTSFGRQKYLPTALGEELKKVLRDAANAFVDTLKTQIRTAKVLDLGRTMQPTLPGSTRIAGLLSPEPPGRYRAGRTEETQTELFARREREARMRSALRGVDVMGETPTRAPDRYSYANRPAMPRRPTSAMVPYEGGGALVPTGGGAGGGVPPRPPSGGGGMGGAGSFGSALSGINLPGTGVVREIGSEFAMAAKQVLLFGTAYKALAFLTSFPAQVGQAVGALQSFNNTLKAISPTANEAKASNQFILDIVDRYNVPLQSARDGFTKLYASMAPAGFKGDEIRALFTGVSQAAATFGMSADKVDRVNYAFAQMASKGQVMSEELKGQLGDVLPGAMGIFAEAAGFTGPDAIQKFSKALEDGAYKGEAMRGLLKNVTVVLTKEFGPGAEGAARTFQGVINRMQNSTRLLYEAFEPVAVGFLNSVVVPLTSGIKTITDGFNAFFTSTQAKTAGGMAFAQELERLKPAFEGIRANVAALMPVLQTLGGVLLEVGKVFLQIAGNPFVGYLARVYLSVLPLVAIIKVLNLQALIPMIGSLLRAIPAFVTFNSLMLQGNRAGLALKTTTFLLGTTSSVTAGKIRLVGTALLSLGMPAVLLGIGALIERFMMLKGAVDGVRQSTQQMVGSISSLANTGAVREIKNIGADTQKQIATFKGLKPFVSGGLGNAPQRRLTEDAAKKMEELGLGAFVSKGVTGPFVNDFLNASKIIEERLKGLGKTADSVKEKMPLAEKAAAALAKQAKQGIEPIGGGAGAGAGKKPKEQSLESYHSLQDQLAKNFTQDQLDRIEQEYQARVNRINSEFDLREARANSFQKEAIRFERQMSDIELKRQKALLDASAEVIKAQGSVAGGASGQSTTGATGLLQGSTGISSGAHFDVRRQDGSYISPEQAKALFDPSVRRQLAMTSAYGPRRAPVPGASTFHKGVDLAGPANTPLNLAPGFAMTGSGEKGGLGYAASVRGPSGEMYDVGHLQRPKAGMGTPRKVTGDEKRDVIADQKAQLAVAQKSLAVQIAEAQAVRDAAVAWAQYSTSIAPIEEQKLQNSLLTKKNELVKLGLPDDVIEKEIKQFETQQKTALAVEVVKKMLAEKKISAENAAKMIAELNTNMAAYNGLLGDNLELQRQQSFDASMGALQKQITMAAPVGGTGLAAGFIGDAGAKYEEAIKEGRSQDEAARFAELQNQLTLLETRNGAVKSSVLAIGDAFATAMTTGVAGLISGTATAQEVFASFLKSVGDALLQAAQQMIATYIAIGIAKIFAGLGGGGNFTGGTSSALPTDAAGWGSSFQTSLPGLSGDIGRTPIGFAKGGAFSNSIVTAPTMFKFADGGAMKAGLMGEAGPEAIMPLSRGSGGRLGVDASGLREAMDRQGGGGNGSPVLNMSFQSTSINGVEYVSRDQLESAMAETRRNATRDGAKRGMTMTLDRIQNSSSTRRRAGI